MVFADISKQAGLDKVHHRSGSAEKTTIIDAPGSGVALLDFRQRRLAGYLSSDRLDRSST
jgi:hypothetical protein